MDLRNPKWMYLKVGLFVVVDPQYRFAGLISFFQYLLSTKSRLRDPPQAPAQGSQAVGVSQSRLARIAVVTFGAGLTSLGVLLLWAEEVWPGVVLCVLAGVFASRSGRRALGREVREAFGGRGLGPGRFR